VNRAILHDPTVYPEPEVFKPERFLDNTAAFADSKNAAFGYGRRFVDPTS
jgi:cytochrome P450 family 2 subfamily U polypeptide 1